MNRFSGGWCGKREMNASFLIIGTFLGFFISSFATMSSLQLSERIDVEARQVGFHRRKSCTTPHDGWSQVHVFTDDESNIVDASNIPRAYFDQSSWFSQVRQDEIVSQLLHRKRNGYFVDLAANDAVRISNTYALERNLGWDGLCIEPNPIYWNGLAHRKCRVIGAVVGNMRGESVKFRFPRAKAPQGGIVGPDFDNKHFKKDEVQTRLTTTLAEVLEQFNAPKMIDYLSLDVEGAELMVMETFPFSKFTVKVLTIERASPELEKLLQRNGYTQLKKLKKWGEALWIHQSMLSKIDTTALEIDSEHYKYRESVSR